MIARHRRNTELGLLLLAVTVTMSAYVLSALGRTADLPAGIGPFLGVVVALFVGAHVAVRRLAPGADPVLVPVAVLLNGVGYVVIARLDEARAAAQATWTLVGIAAFVLTLVVVYRVRDLARTKWTFALAGIALLLLPMVPGLGRTINDSRIWVGIGPLSFQPGEFAKLALAAFFAGYLVERRELLSQGLWRLGPLRLPAARDLAPVVAAWLLTLAVMGLQNDLGAALLFFTLFVVLLWVATEQARWLVVGALMFAAGATLAWRAFPRVEQRVTIWLDPWSQAQGNGYQIVQGLFSLAWGGLTGRGLGLGDPGRVPNAHNDFILSAIGEELGLFGTTAVVIAFLVLIGSGLRIALRDDRPFEKLLATGLTLILGLQAFLIMGGVTRLLPLTGVTLPFVSYGGSSLVANYVLLALLVRLSDDASQRAGETPHRPPRTWHLRLLGRRPQVEPAPLPPSPVDDASPARGDDDVTVTIPHVPTAPAGPSAGPP